MEGDAETNRKAALDRLRFRKTTRQDTLECDSPQPANANNPALLFAAPPSQSRDASAPTHYYPPSTPSTSRGILLVPNSSPTAPETNPQPAISSQQPSYAHNVLPMTGQGHYNLWNQPTHSDPLSASSGFVNGGRAVHASFTRNFGGDIRRLSDMDGYSEDGPPRKRIHLGGSLDTQSLQNTRAPDSPEIQRLGQRRKANLSSGGLSTSSEDSMPDIRQSLEPSTVRSRLLRGQRPGSSEPTESREMTQSKDAFTVFRIANIDRDVNLVQAAWAQAGGDDKKATSLLNDPLWKPPSFSTESKSPKLSVPTDPPAETGRVTEVDEATKANRAALREKAKKSSIYANRIALDTTQSTPTSAVPTSSIPVVASPASPSTPLVAPRRRRINKVVVSESEPSDSEDELGNSNQSVKNTERGALDFLNTANIDGLQELTGCTPEQADKIISLRPFVSTDDINAKLGQGRKKAGPAGISPRLFEDCQRVLGGYGAVDGVLEKCERIGASLRAAIASWSTDGANSKGKGKEDATKSVSSLIDEVEEGSLNLKSIKSATKEYFAHQPATLTPGITLKDYQLLGINWLYLLYKKEYSCILADEMGLGKTIQVISFFAHLKERGNAGPHLVIVPSSTLENWCREFSRFAPSISIQTYYAGKEERPTLRQTLIDTQRRGGKGDNGWEVLVTTYNLAQGDDRDRKFFRRIEWDCIVFDEGHVLKNFQSQRYQALLKFDARWRLLLTGTPLQNNLQELVSLLNFILPNLLGETMDSLRAIFKTKGDAKVALLSQERISRAKKMMTPFVLRRRKDQVLKDLPQKTERIEWCEMTGLQRSIYTDALQRSRKTILEVGPEAVSRSGTSTPNGVVKKRPAKMQRPKDKYAENSSNVLMELRKAASHPMLFRRLYTDQVLTSVTKLLLKEPDFKKRGAVFEYVKEDMEVMTDAELQFFCRGYKSTRKYLQNEKCFLDAGKITVLLRLLEDYGRQKRKVLIFSQFTQILDILQAILKQKNLKYLLLTGSTAVDVRQSLVDEFTEDESIPIFLLSTKAGGMGINLTAASVVIVFDQDFNPHNDRQAQDRAYRIGQKQDVDVVKLITRGTIEEDMLRLGEAKLALDEAVAGDAEEDGDKGESKQETEMKMSLMNVLRKQLEQQDSRQSGTITPTCAGS